MMESLELLVRDDPVSRPLARLYIIALQYLETATYRLATDQETPVNGSLPSPLLTRQVVAIEQASHESLVHSLAEALAEEFPESQPDLVRRTTEIPVIQLMSAAANWDFNRLAELGDAARIEPSMLSTIAHCAVLPMFMSLANNLSGNVSPSWTYGHCPVCGSWPVLGELRGLDRARWLRCGRCATEWRTRHQRCTYCDNSDHQTLGYLAPENDRERRRVTTCEQCRGYLKEFSVVTRVDNAELLRLDIDSVELDIAAIDRDYQRPEQPGFPLELSLEPAVHRTGRWWFS